MGYSSNQYRIKMIGNDWDVTGWGHNPAKPEKPRPLTQKESLDDSESEDYKVGSIALKMARQKKTKKKRKMRTHDSRFSVMQRMHQCQFQP